MHIGPPKCGSSSIQNYLKSECSAQYRHVAPSLIDLMNQQPDLMDQKVVEFIGEVNRLVKSDKVVILSHEYFFECHYAIKYICDQVKVDRITIIGYVRRSSHVLVAAFNQWEFRNPDMSDDIQRILRTHKIDSNLFLGVEAYLMAIILASEKLVLRPYNWSEEYGSLESLLKYDHVEIKVNALPSNVRSYDLIVDFCDKAGLSKENYSPDVINPSFSEIVVESFYRTSNEFKNRVGQHGFNHFFRKLSAEMNDLELSDTNFFKSLCLYIDGENYSETLSFSQRYGIPESELLTNHRIEKDEVLKLIKEENELRKSQLDVLQNNQKEAAEWAVCSFDDFLTHSKKKSSRTWILKLISIFKKK